MGTILKSEGFIDVGITVLSVDPARTLGEKFVFVGTPVEELDAPVGPSSSAVSGGVVSYVNLTILSVPLNRSIDAAFDAVEEVTVVAAPSTTEPSRCGAGFFSAQDECSVCPGGFWCPDGTVAMACPAGTHSPARGAADNRTCAACGVGMYAPEAGAVQCAPCPAGFFCETEGAAEANECPPHTGSGEGAKSAADCVCSYGYVCKYGRRITLTLSGNFSNGLFSSSDDLGTARLLAAMQRAIEAATMGIAEVVI